MTESTFLKGRVRRISLTTILGSEIVPMPGIKRLLLSQGELAQFYDGEEPMRYIAAIELRPGTVRGNHYHKLKPEWLYVLHGELLLRVAGVDDNAQDSFPLGAGELAFVPAGIAHALHVRVFQFHFHFSN